MEFLHSWLIAAIIPFLLLLFLLKKIEKRRFSDIPTSLIVKKIGGLKLFAKKCGKVLWIFTAILIVTALMRPQSIGRDKIFGVEGRIMILSVDLSTSMSDAYYSKNNRASIDVIKELSLEFVKKRASTDFIGITAYGGRYSGRQGGEAAIIVSPTSEYTQLEASIKELKPKMLGFYTSIGEGIFISILSLVDYDALQKIKQGNPNYFNDLEKSIESEDKTYALNVIRELGRLKNCVIVLFTDGKNNAGIEPAYPLWLCKMLGIKVHLGALESTGATGLSEEEQARRKALLIGGVLETGGKYFEMNIIEQAREFYEEVDKLETAHLKFKNFETRKDIFFWPIVITLIAIGVIISLENIFPRIQ